ncbi:hypothetical protein GALL_537810 [mine drainage metagenome]|uniref:Uncharacterized protein n=1 Tax=mine drainage metagenome TaxID=410659 RepID=A0A1J5PHB2_9ZZZZ
MGCVDGDLVVGAVTLLDAEVVVFQVDVEIGQDQLLLDEIPDDAGHFVAVEFDDGVGYLDLGHHWPSWFLDSVGRVIAENAGGGKMVCDCIPNET